MDVEVISTAFCLVLLLFGCAVANPVGFTEDDPRNITESLVVEERGNGYDNYLPLEPGAPYNIHLNVLKNDVQKDPDCMLGNAYNYMPWLFPNGSLTIKNESVALDLSNLMLGDRGLVSLVDSLHELTNYSNIRYLALGFNQLTLLPVSTLKLFSSLEYLSLVGNPLADFTLKLETRPKLPSLPALVSLDMRDCRLRNFPTDFFNDVPKLQYLFLAYNYISKLPEPLFNRLSKLTHLDLSHMNNTDREEELRAENPFMKLIAGMDMDPNVFEPLVKLRFLDLSYTKLELKAFIALSSLGTRLEYASYCLMELPTLLDHLFLMRSIKMLDLSGYIGGGRTLNKGSLTLLRDSLEVLYFRDSEIHRLDWLQGLHKLRVLNLRGNLVTSLIEAPFNDLPNLEVLDMNFNFVQSWPNEMFSQNLKLNFVSLRYNNLMATTSAMLRDFEDLKYLAIGGNSLKCSCNYVYLMQVAAGNSSVLVLEKNGTIDSNYTLPVEFLVTHVNLLDFKDEDYRCMDYTTRVKVNPYELTVCAHEDEDNYINTGEEEQEYLEDIIEDYLVIYIVVSFLFVLLMGITFFIYWYWFYIKYFCVMFKNSAILSFFNDDQLYLDKSSLIEESMYNYDVFVSYSENDRFWVLDRMLPMLEQDSFVSVCLHERDFEVGYSILENIISCMDRSRCLMLIVSESFLQSRWCQFEMHLAQHRLLETRRDELILVLLEDIPKRKCPKTLSYLMKTKTYIKWPRERAQEQELFWKRLRRALTTSKR
ncbi:toll-like receptor 13 [Wyeomyia smithii]|uniref:toll-like receptor 13 n=1 Tax=Wyeomyia smithii TaxID=174621 RepID=UPI002467EAF2|nr:toll-like receptor 13 [Wyeomyia smithii]